MKWIADELKLKPELIPAMVQHLKSLGCDVGDKKQKAARSSSPAQDSTQGTPSKAGSAAGSSDRTTLSWAGAEVVPSADEDEDEEEQEPGTNSKTMMMIIPKKYKVWETVPSAYIQAILKAMEPVSFSLPNLRSFHPKGCKYLLKDPLLSLVEFSLDWDRKATVSFEQRNVARLLDMVKDLNIRKGRRGQNLELPCDWEAVGHYRVADSEAGVVLTLNTVGPVITKLVCSIGCLKKVTSADQLQVMENWNLLSAVVIVKQCGTRCPAIMLFQGELALATALNSAMEQIVIEDGSQETKEEDEQGEQKVEPGEQKEQEEHGEQKVDEPKPEQEEHVEQIVGESQGVNEEGLVHPPPA